MSNNPLSEKPGRFNTDDVEDVLAITSKRTVDQRHWKMAFFLCIFVLFPSVFLIDRAFPSKVIEAYRFEVDQQGNQSVQKMKLQPYEPNTNEIRARLKDIVVRMYSIDKLMNTNLRMVEQHMSGQARAQFGEFITEEKMFARIQEAPELLREVNVASVDQLQNKVFLIDFTTKERIGSNAPVVKRKTMTMTIEIIPAKTDEEVLGNNPAGIYCLSFTISDKVNHEK